MCVNPQTIKHPVTGKYILVPCGRCVECMKDKQNDTAVMCVREAEKRGSFHFVTLTYKPEEIPMYFTIIEDDPETGERVVCGSPARCPDPETEKVWRENYYRAHGKNDSSLSDIYTATDEDGEFQYYVTPSLCREDVKDFLKRARRHYEYHHNTTLDFSYICAGEYGPNTCRPHYHLGIFGLNTAQVTELFEDWRVKKGFITISEVEPVTLEDGKNHYEAAGKYVGKYISKPAEIEHIAVREGRVEKPRRQTSAYFGIKDDEEALKRYHYCYDMVGEYDPEDPEKFHEFFQSMDKEQRIELLKEIIKRKKYYLNGKNYKLPRKISRALFYRCTNEVAPDGTTKRKESPIVLQSLVTAYLRSYFNKNFDEELQSLKMQYGDEVPFEKIREIVHNENIVRQDRAKTIFTNMVKNTYKTSYF